MKYLGKESELFNAKPSDRVYFGKYPYKIKLNFRPEVIKSVNEHMKFYQPTGDEVLDHIVQKEMFDPDYGIAQQIQWMEQKRHFSALVSMRDLLTAVDMQTFCRFYTNYYTCDINMYVPNKETYKKILKAFPKNVVGVAGPWNLKHKKLLADPDTTVAVRSKPFWGKYNIKVTARHRRMWMDKRREENVHLLDFLKQSISPEEVRFQSHNYYNIIFWTSEQQLADVIPFLKIAHPNVALHVTRCFSAK